MPSPELHLWRSRLISAMLLALRFVQARLISVWGLAAAALLCPISLALRSSR